MGSAERRREIMKLLCRRRHETIENMAFEFGVSERTIRRDIEILSLREPIYTQSGRYGGGVYVTENYSIDRLYMSEEEENILRKLKKMAENHEKCILAGTEMLIFNRLIDEYSKPKPRNLKGQYK